LVSRAGNDIYQVNAGGQVFALKVARTGRTDASFAFEPAFVTYLDRIGFTVPTPFATRDGPAFFSVDAPEGARQIMLTKWLAGTPLTSAINEDQTRQLGAWLARIHQAGALFQNAVRRPVEIEARLTVRLPALLELARGDAAMTSFLGRAAQILRQYVATLDARAVPRGVCHGDFHYGNIMLLPDRTIAVLDFAECGEDYLVSDLACFFWRADFDGVGDRLNAAFVAGYEAVRPLTPAERGALTLFRAVHHLAVACAFADQTNRTGPVPSFESNLRYYLSMIRLYCAEAGVT
jgi:homoserine kinase type II